MTTTSSPRLANRESISSSRLCNFEEAGLVKEFIDAVELKWENVKGINGAMGPTLLSADQAISAPHCWVLGLLHSFWF